MRRARANKSTKLRTAARVACVAAALAAAPCLAHAQSPPTVKFVQQRGLLYIPVDIMVSGGVLQAQATKLGLGKVDATATALSGPGAILDALLSGAADYGTAALPSLLTLWEKTRGSANEVRAVGTVSNGAMTIYTINPNVKTLADFTDKDRIAVRRGTLVGPCGRQCLAYHRKKSRPQQRGRFDAHVRVCVPI